MSERSDHRPRPQSLSPLQVIARVAIMLTPAALLMGESLRTSDERLAVTLWIGTGFQFVVCLLCLVTPRSWRQPVGPSAVVLFVIGLGWLWLGASARDDWYTHVAFATFLIVPVVLFSAQVFHDTGAPMLRRARILAERLGKRNDWSSDLAACKLLPEVKELREALALDAAPALVLLDDPRPHVRIAALAALEFRKRWWTGQAELVLQAAHRAEEAPVRAAAVMALGNLDDPSLISSLAGYLRDRSWEVRRAATEALLWDCEHRWTLLRQAIRATLNDSAFQDDGPLRFECALLPIEAVRDLNAWANEKGVLGQRAALTLGFHYGRILNDRHEPALLSQLREQLANRHSPPALRMELARLLQSHKELDFDLQEKLLDTANPAPLRLLASEALLATCSHPGAVAALHDLAHLPNREMALATADVVQRRLSVDMGLSHGQPLPPVHSRQATEVTRRLMAWAAQEAKSQQPAAVASVP
jgi:HEAT repeat protein